jgi:hypothetical protein
MEGDAGVNQLIAPVDIEEWETCDDPVGARGHPFTRRQPTRRWYRTGILESHNAHQLVSSRPVM